MKNKKYLGQHWLNNRAILDEIAGFSAGYEKGNLNKKPEKSYAPQFEEICLEIGPGLGTLTSSLFKYFDKIIAVEFDQKLAENLPKSFPGKNLEVINGDILDFDFNLIKTPYVVAGNIPYYITSPIIEKLLTLRNKPERIVLLIQKEVAERITDKKETLLSLLVKNRAEVELGPVVLKNEFTPPPKVDSQVIIFRPREPKILEEVFELIKLGFSSPRKKLVHNLSRIKGREEWLKIFDKLKIKDDARPGDLTLEDWQKLYYAYLGK
ncbi:ribosomal RNA small subunit methyltransferase A [Candidatus Saccharibacteria bacterium]|nr:ribosomal RNA small subunit methyltransferase A [Candidatus Saccharibacteria bacterium]